MQTSSAPVAVREADDGNINQFIREVQVIGSTLEKNHKEGDVVVPGAVPWVVREGLWKEVTFERRLKKEAKV